MKKLDDQLIINTLEEKGVYDPHDLDHDAKLDAIKEHYEFTISDDWGNPNIMFYTETTADGYEVWIATEDDRSPYIGQDVYYYDNDWLEKMPQAMYDGCDIYYPDVNDEDYAFQEVVDEVYEEYYSEKRKETEEELIEDGYEWEE